MRSTRPVQPSPPIIAALVCAGWVLHDLTQLAYGGDATDAMATLPGSGLAIGMAGFLGWLESKHRLLLPATLVGLALGTGLSLAGSSALSRSSRWIAPALLLMAVGYGLSLWALRRPRSATLPIGLGVLACVVLTLCKSQAPSWPLAALAGLGVAHAFVSAKLGQVSAALAYLVVAAAGIAAGFASQPDNLREATDPPRAASATQTNLVLIVLDTVRADHISAYGYEHRTTPHIDAFFAARGTRHEQARSASSWTLPSHASMFTGWLPSEHGADVMGVDALPLAEEAETIAEVLQAAGYQTAAIVSNLAYFSPRIGLDRGFGHFDNRPAGWSDGHLPLIQLFWPRPRIGNSVYRRADRITDAALEWLDQRTPAPFLLFVNYMDAHDPLFPPASDLFGEEQPLSPADAANPNLRLLYARSLAYLDEHVGRLLDDLAARDLLETTAIVLTGDHGEGLGDRNFRGHGRHLHDELIRVPLFVKAAPEQRPGVSLTPISSVGIHAELFRLVGLTAPEREPNPIISEWRYLRDESPEKRRRLEQRLGRPLDLDLLVWLVGDLKFIAASDGSIAAYDLRTDPGEERPVELPAEVEQRARERAFSWWAEHPLRSVESTSSEDELRALKNLGYTD